MASTRAYRKMRRIKKAKRIKRGLSLCLDGREGKTSFVKTSGGRRQEFQITPEYLARQGIEEGEIQRHNEDGTEYYTRRHRLLVSFRTGKNGGSSKLHRDIIPYLCHRFKLTLRPVRVLEYVECVNRVFLERDDKTGGELWYTQPNPSQEAYDALCASPHVLSVEVIPVKLPGNGSGEFCPKPPVKRSNKQLDNDPSRYRAKLKHKDRTEEIGHGEGLNYYRRENLHLIHGKRLESKRIK